ncbi:hypothetical protein DJ95_187 [Bacillus atrophaeus subsp. globigii]|uniref:Uncharacterized protein n=1 Tax=Bacillus atrophaeus (strain 1942) TaxID=720555 RepID=A0ABM5LTK5_BACA1|nr:hypothetical protein BATR1942_01280 [Bacillus atrophaeus 1942]AIK47804.1 hypothetical protein DJ95_187 [Bacillus atrophaeus subsp. globigii]EIM09416.1 hypothetical protein UY9_17521 [Bacillus atrophaeus C89]KFK81273.1 hypothetical protein DK44_3447 [Bacillus atrophaeus]MDQ0926594.1 hypothetical protein [Bacillus atrophaeus]
MLRSSTVNGRILIGRNLLAGIWYEKGRLTTRYDLLLVLFHHLIYNELMNLRED